MIKVNSPKKEGLENHTYNLMQKMLNPICGITQEIGFIKRSKFGAKIITAGAEITGVHNLLMKPDPGRGAYHTGGAGLQLNEAVIKSLAESVERYCQLISGITQKNKTLFLSYDEMHKNHSNVLEKEYLDLYTDKQLSSSQFPFKKFNEALPLSWIEVVSIITGETHFAPTQLLLVGYDIQHQRNEPWYSTAVTTGTAAHTNPIDALLGALLEIIQVDSTIGHWYTNFKSPLILFDERTKPMEKILKTHQMPLQRMPTFFWLKNPDLAGISVACILEKSEKSYPRVAVGLGASTTLNDAMYKAYLEATGVANLSNILMLKESLYRDNKNDDAEINYIYDIDSNVSLYGRGINYSFFESKFNKQETITASNITPDLIGTKIEKLNTLIKSFKNSNKEILFSDLSSIEARELGFYIPRLWSKDTLSLCLPSAPPAKHPRFNDYGGFTHDAPHPYP
jgi:thiazole/oxazole-forming peptide maturase SagD family component